MKNWLQNFILIFLLLCTQQLIAQVEGKRNVPAIDSIKVIDTVLAFKPHNVPNDSFPMNQNIRICAPSRGKIITPPPLFVLKNDNRILIVDKDKMLNPKCIKSINVLKDAATTAKYGSKGLNGVIEITVNEDSILLSVEKILSVYNLPKKWAKYPVYIDDKYCAKDAIMLERSKIKSVKVIERLMSGINEKQLEIITIDKME